MWSDGAATHLPSARAGSLSCELGGNTVATWGTLSSERLLAGGQPPLEPVEGCCRERDLLLGPVARTQALSEGPIVTLREHVVPHSFIH